MDLTRRELLTRLAAITAIPTAIWGRPPDWQLLETAGRKGGPVMGQQLVWLNPGEELLQVPLGAPTVAELNAGVDLSPFLTEVTVDLDSWQMGGHW